MLLVCNIMITEPQIIDCTRCLTVYLSLWFSCPRFSRGYHARWRVRHLLPKWRLLPKCVIAHVSWRGLHLLPKWQPTRAHKNRGHNFGWVRHLVLSIICDRGIARGVLVCFEFCLIVLWLWDKHFSYIRTRRNTSPCLYFLRMRINRILSHN
jgi:hypothetical protein